MGPKDHISRRILHSGSKVQYKRDTRNHGLQDPFVSVVFWGPKKSEGPQTERVHGASKSPYGPYSPAESSRWSGIIIAITIVVIG